jgi:hypothetical protein
MVGRTWWAHLAFTRINIEPTILQKDIEENPSGPARRGQQWRSAPAIWTCVRSNRESPGGIERAWEWAAERIRDEVVGSSVQLTVAPLVREVTALFQRFLLAMPGRLAASA